MFSVLKVLKSVSDNTTKVRKELQIVAVLASQKSGVLRHWSNSSCSSKKKEGRYAPLSNIR